MMTPEKLRAIYGPASVTAAAKGITAFDGHCRQFIAHSPFLMLTTTDGTHLDVSPKGDAPGFVSVESDTTLLIPDRPGNNRLDGLLNVLACPQVALIFLIPSVTETLRVNGTAEVLDDPDLLAPFAVKGRLPKTVLRVTAQEIFTHCGKAPLRAGLWAPDSWPTTRPVPTLYEMVRDHAQMEVPSTSQDYVDKRYRDTLY
ncbi:MAG: pyridoxamine 5'-phosphate oxidase family protein [Pseudomonadota bacterium]